MRYSIIFLLLYSSISFAGVYSGESDINGIKWKNSGKHIGCGKPESLGKMYVTEGSSMSYAFSSLYIICHNFGKKSEASWIVVANSNDSAISGLEVNSHTLRYQGYLKYVAGKNCRLTVEGGWRCDDYSIVKNNSLDINITNKSKMLNEPSPYSKSKLVEDMLDESSSYK